MNFDPTPPRPAPPRPAPPDCFGLIDLDWGGVGWGGVGWGGVKCVIGSDVGILTPPRPPPHPRPAPPRPPRPTPPDFFGLIVLDFLCVRKRDSSWCKSTPRGLAKSEQENTFLFIGIGKLDDEDGSDV